MPAASGYIALQNCACLRRELHARCKLVRCFAKLRLSPAGATCPLQAGTLLCKTAPVSGGSYMPAASWYVALQNCACLRRELHARCKRVHCFAKPQNVPLPKTMDAAVHANCLFGRSSGFSPGPGWGRSDNFLLSGGLCFYIASTSAFVSRAIISSSLVHTTSTFTRLPSPVISLMSSPRSLFFSASIEMPRNSISLHTSLRT